MRPTTGMLTEKAAAIKAIWALINNSVWLKVSSFSHTAE